VVLVVLDEPKAIKETFGFATAGWNAAPTAGNIINRIAPMLGVFPIGHEDSFEPLAGLIAARMVKPERSEYSGPVRTAVAAPAPVVPVGAPLPDNGESDRTIVQDDKESIGALIDTIGGDGEVE
jgi:hypothetical protein